MSTPFCVLSIAGSDSGGGAGIQVDQRTIRAIGGHALTAVTAVTAQDLNRVVAWERVSGPLIRAQVEAMLRGFTVSAVKTGLLPGSAAVRVVARALKRVPMVPLVVDPVLSSSSGTVFLTGAGIRTLKSELLPIASLVTPNWPEASALTGLPVGSFAQASRAAARLADECGCPVLVKGGHAPGDLCRDYLALPGDEPTSFESPRIETPNTHGTGCVLSAAIAAWLGRGASLPESVRLARSFLTRALVRGRGVKWNGRGTAYFGAR